MRELAAGGWAPLFILMFDEPWRLMESTRALAKSLLGEDAIQLEAVCAWHVDPAKKQRGFEPHRDRIRPTLDASGRPEQLTLWIALSDATVENSCIHVWPASEDPHYREELENNDIAPDAKVCALTAPSSTILVWTHQLLHWGPEPTRLDAPPRISIASEYVRAGAELDSRTLPEGIPPFKERLAIVGRQIIQYSIMAGTPQALLEIARQLATR
jgi:hypothetical protein